MSILIQAHNLYYTYRLGSGQEVKALRGVNLTVERGEFLVITGQNGSGKSTLARHFNALLKPTSGQVLVDGLCTKNKHHKREIRKKVGMVFQNPDNQIISTIVEEDVAFGLENLGIPREEIRRRVDEALKTVRMYDLRYESPAQLSDGQKQMVAIAGVTAMQPECIVMDEPTAHLDPQGRREVMWMVKKLNREEGITVIFITHFMKEAIEADRMLVMDGGEIEMEGSPREVFSQTQGIRDLGMDMPVPLQLAQGLRRRGIPLSHNLIHAEELVRELCQLK